MVNIGFERSVREGDRGPARSHGIAAVALIARRATLPAGRHASGAGGQRARTARAPEEFGGGGREQRPLHSVAHRRGDPIDAGAGQGRPAENDDRPTGVARDGTAPREAQNGRQAEGHRGPGADHPGPGRGQQPSADGAGPATQRDAAQRRHRRHR